MRFIAPFVLYSTMNKKIYGAILIAVSALMYGAYGLFANYLEHYPLFFQAYVRCALIALVFFIWSVLNKSFRKIDKEDYKWFIVLGIFTSFSVVPITYAFQHLTLGASSFIFYASYTIIAYILGFAFFKEKLTRVKLISLVLAMIGLITIFSFDLTAVILLPAVFAIVNGIASGGEVTFSKKVSDKYSGVFISFFLYIVIAISHFFISLALGEAQPVEIITVSWPYLAGYILVAVIGMVTVIEGFKHVEPTIGSIVGLLEIVFSALFGILLLSERLTIATLFGGILIVIAAGLPNIIEYYKSIQDKSKRD